MRSSGNDDEMRCVDASNGKERKVRDNVGALMSVIYLGVRGQPVPFLGLRTPRRRIQKYNHAQVR